MLLTTEVIKNDISLLFSKHTMKKANTYIEFANDKIIILNKVPVNFTTSGHYCFEIGNIVHDNYEVLKSDSILVCDDVNNNLMIKSKKLLLNCTVSFAILLVINLLSY